MRKLLCHVKGIARTLSSATPAARKRHGFRIGLSGFVELIDTVGCRVFRTGGENATTVSDSYEPLRDCMFILRAPYV